MRPPSKARDKIIQAAYELFAAHGIHSTGVDAVIARSGVARMTLYRHFGSKADLVLAFLDYRATVWTERWLTAEVNRRASDPRDRLLEIFELYHEWFQRPDFEGCSFTKTLLETDAGSPIHISAARHLDNLRRLVEKLARDADIADAESLSHIWHILMIGSVTSAFAGRREAALDAKRAAAALLRSWPVR